MHRPVRPLIARLRPAFALAMAAALTGASLLGVGPAPAPVQPDSVNLATFDTVWVVIRDTHWDPTINGLDWNAVRDELRPKAEKATNQDELRSVLAEMISRLGQSHFAILPGNQLLESPQEHDSPAQQAGDPKSGDGEVADSKAGNGKSASDNKAADGKSAETQSGEPRKVRRRDPFAGDTGASLSLLKAPGSGADRWEAVITAVRPDSNAAKAGLKPGQVVSTIDGRELTRDLPTGAGLQRYERGAIVRARATGRPGTTTTWKVRSADGTDRDVQLTHMEDTRPKEAFGGLPPIPVGLDWSTLPPETAAKFGASGAKIGTIAFDSWFIPIALPFNKAIDQLRDSDGIILDLRGNPGGLGGMVMGVAGHFTPKSERMGTMITREGELNFVTNPRLVSTQGKPVQTFAGPVAILVDDGTASTSEIFAGGMQYLKRAHVFGSRTAGAALPATFEELPNGDVFLHAIADYRLPDGRTLEASGVKPDVERTYTHEDYARDGDPVLADAVRWIAEQRATRAKELQK